MSEAGPDSRSWPMAFGESFEFEDHEYVVVFEVARGEVLAMKAEDRKPAHIYLVTLPQPEDAEDQPIPCAETTEASDKEVRLWTSGSCLEDSGSGGWAYVRQEADGVISIASGGDQNTTMMRMQIRAVIEALNALPQRDIPLVAHPDSQVVVKTMTGEQPPSTDHDPWEELKRAANDLKITWQTLESGAVLPDPERCGRLAQIASAQQAKSRSHRSES